MNLSLDLDGERAVIRATGYLSLQAGENLSVLLRDLGRMEIREIGLDIAGCSPVCIAALENLLDRKFQLAHHGVNMTFSRPSRSVSKVFQIMGLRPNGELLTGSGSGGPGQQVIPQDV